MGWCMNHRGTSVHFVPKESTNTQGQTICRGTLPHSIGITTTSEADSSLLDMFVSITWIKIQMTPSCAKYLRKDVRAVAGVDEGALGADKIFCYVYPQRGDQEHGVYMDDTQADKEEYISAYNSFAHRKRYHLRLRRALPYICGMSKAASQLLEPYFLCIVCMTVRMRVPFSGLTCSCISTGLESNYSVDNNG